MVGSTLFSRIINNFYYRNIIVLLLLLIAYNSTRVAVQGFVVLGVLGYSATFILFYFVFIFHNRLLYPHLLFRKRYLLYTFATIGLVLSYQYVSRVMLLAMNAPAASYNAFIFLSYTLHDLVELYLAFGIYLAFIYFREREETLNLENLKREVELKNLKDSLNPAFLFNALNNIHQYAVSNKASADELILKLSELMRFILVNADKDNILLVDEITFIEHYISFEAERLGKKCTVQFQRTVGDQDLFIAPFILFSVIEGVFKQQDTGEDTCCINLDVKVTDVGVELKIVSPVISHHSHTLHFANIHRRLELLYPGAHMFTTTVQDGSYITSLSISLQP